MELSRLIVNFNVMNVIIQGNTPEVIPVTCGKMKWERGTFDPLPSLEHPMSTRID